MNKINVVGLRALYIDQSAFRLIPLSPESGSCLTMSKELNGLYSQQPPNIAQVDEAIKTKHLAYKGRTHVVPAGFEPTV